MNYNFLRLQYDWMADKFLLIHLSHLHIRSTRLIGTEYLSFHSNQQFYFSNAYDASMIHNYSIPLNHSIVIPFQQNLMPTTLKLQNWQNHMILFEHTVSIIQLHNRPLIKKKVEVRQGEILQFTIQMLQQNEFQLSPIFQENMLQHFLIIHELKLLQPDVGEVDTGPSYLIVSHDDHKTIIPVVDAIVTVPIPSTLKFQHIKNAKLLSYSQDYDFKDINKEKVSIGMAGKRFNSYNLQLSCLWGINMQRKRADRAMLVDSQQIMLYDIQIKLQGWKQIPVGLKIKILYGNKCFELNGQIDANKSMRLARIVYFIVKSEEQSFSFVIEKGLKIVARAVFDIEELVSYHINMVKKKLIEVGSLRQMASLKLRCQKAKNLSLPQNNPLWKQQISKGKTNSVIVQFTQMSLDHSDNGNYSLMIKTEEQEMSVDKIPNSCIFKLQVEFPPPIILTFKHSYTIYFKLIDLSSQNNKDSIGIATINFKQLRLGLNCLSLPFFKQKTTVCHLNMLVNKVVPWPFVKGIGYPESNHISSKQMKITICLKKILLSQYYYSYQYDRKNDLYCIIEVNRVKKVLILERFKTATTAIIFVNSNGSDLLNYSVDFSDSLQIKCTFLVCDGEIDEEIYGSIHKKVNISEISDGPINLPSLRISNEYSIDIGQVDLQVQKMGVTVQHKKPIKQELREVKLDLDKVNKSIEKVQQFKKSPNKNKKYESIVLPSIKDPKQERLNKIRNLKMQRSLQKRPVMSERNIVSQQKNINQRYYTPIELQPIENIKEQYFGGDKKRDNLSGLLQQEGEQRRTRTKSKVEIDIQELSKNQFLDG